MTTADLAGRAGISLVTLRRVERGEGTVAIGTVFEVAFLLGIDLFGTPADNARRMDRTRDVLRLLPERVRPRLPAIDDDF